MTFHHACGRCPSPASGPTGATRCRNNHRVTGLAGGRSRAGLSSLAGTTNSGVALISPSPPRFTGTGAGCRTPPRHRQPGTVPGDPGSAFGGTGSPHDGAVLDDQGRGAERGEIVDVAWEADEVRDVAGYQGAAREA